jgi:hypothetical protein
MWGFDEVSRGGMNQRPSLHVDTLSDKVSRGLRRSSDSQNGIGNGLLVAGRGAVATTDSRIFSELRIDSAEQSDEGACISGRRGGVFWILDGRLD